MITREEILEGQECPPELEANLLELLHRLNIIRQKYGRPMIVTSGFRSKRKHLAIYAKKGIKDTKKIPMKSKHLFCQAADISDPQKKLQKWILNNLHLLEEIGLWVEDFKYTPNWVHLQIVPYKSWVKGKSRFFIP